MSTPQTIASIAAGSTILAIVFLIINFFCGATGRGGLLSKGSQSTGNGSGGVGSFLLGHFIFAVWAGVSWVTFIISMIFVLIDYAKA